VRATYAFHLGQTAIHVPFQEPLRASLDQQKAHHHGELLYVRSQPDVDPAAPGAEYRLVKLLPSHMDVARVLPGLADRLHVPPAPGLDELVRETVQDRVSGRWRV
jgi:hypothetical protein